VFAQQTLQPKLSWRR